MKNRNCLIIGAVNPVPRNKEVIKVKTIRMTINVNFEESDKYNFSEEERDTAIKDLQDTIKAECIMNNIKEAYSWKLASEFICK